MFRCRRGRSGRSLTPLGRRPGRRRGALGHEKLQEKARALLESSRRGARCSCFCGRSCCRRSRSRAASDASSETSSSASRGTNLGGVGGEVAPSPPGAAERGRCRGRRSPPLLPILRVLLLFPPRFLLFLLLLLLLLPFLEIIGILVVVVVGCGVGRRGGAPPEPEQPPPQVLAPLVAQDHPTQGTAGRADGREVVGGQGREDEAVEVEGQVEEGCRGQRLFFVGIFGERSFQVGLELVHVLFVPHFNAISVAACSTRSAAAVSVRSEGKKTLSESSEQTRQCSLGFFSSPPALEFKPFFFFHSRL